MAVSATPVFCQNPKITPQSWTNADSANTKKTICTAGTNGSKVVDINVTSTDTVARVAQLWLTRSAVSYLIMSENIPAGTGSDGTSASRTMFDGNLIFLAPDNDGASYLFLESGDTLQVSFTSQVTAAKEIDVIAVFGNF